MTKKDDYLDSRLWDLAERLYDPQLDNSVWEVYDCLVEHERRSLIADYTELLYDV